MDLEANNTNLKVVSFPEAFYRKRDKDKIVRHCLYEYILYKKS